MYADYLKNFATDLNNIKIFWCILLKDKHIFIAYMFFIFPWKFLELPHSVVLERLSKENKKHIGNEDVFIF